MNTAERKQDPQTNSYLTFQMNSEHFAVSVTKVTELLEMLPVTHVPKSPDFMRGVFNLRGAVVPVIDTRIKFSLPPRPDTIDTCIIVMNVTMDDDVIKIGAIVDSVSEVIEIPDEKILPLPTIGNKLRASFFLGVIKLEEKFIMVLDVDKVFTNEVIISLNQNEAAEHLEEHD
ncbi:MAG TPA: chemotaxis protein CheW [Ohtaekwangia sp.]|nr:chemotaxis protein CheW [Ohtaekwangia sp.]